MAKKARKKAKPAKKTKSRTKKTAKKKTARRAGKSRSIGDRLASGYHIVVDTVTGTEKLRRKMEKPGTDETE
jgi:hypothetical protein